MIAIVNHSSSNSSNRPAVGRSGRRRSRRPPSSSPSRGLRPGSPRRPPPLRPGGAMGPRCASGVARGMPEVSWTRRLLRLPSRTACRTCGFPSGPSCDATATRLARSRASAWLRASRWQKGGRYGWKPSLSSICSIRVVCLFNI